MAENMKKYLDLAGLTRYDGLIKTWVDGRITAEKYDDTTIKNRVGALETLTADYATVQTNAANSVAAWTKFLAGSFTTEVTPTLAQLATKDELSQAISGAVNGLKGTATAGYDTLGGLEAKIKEVASNLTDKNVTAEGETGDAALVSASASGNKVTVASTKKLQDAVALAESALQDVTVATGDNNGEIKVQGHAVAVKGLGSAAYTDATAYDAAGKADDALAAAKTYAEGKAADAQTAAEEVATNFNTAMDARVVKLEADKHNHSNLTELNKIAEGDKEKWDTAAGRINTFLDSEEVAGTVDTLHEIQAWMNGDGVNATELTEAIAAEAKLRGDADQAINDKIGTVADDKTVVEMIGDAQDAAKSYTDGRETAIDAKWAAADVVIDGKAQGYANDAKSAAESAAKSYTDGREIEIDKKWAAADVVIDGKAQGYANDAKSAAIGEAKSYADGLFNLIGAIDTADIEGLFD